MYLNTKKPQECCGCTACFQVCPTKCIEMVADGEGFFYPQKNDKKKCISCGLCEKVCPLNNKEKVYNEEPTCYYGWHKDEIIRGQSTSGAAFYAITQVCRELAIKYFCGAVYNDRFDYVYHICTENLADLQKMRTSKYVQSNMENVYHEVLELLKKGDKVLFSGTPCQVDGLRHYIGSKFDKQLYTVDLVCHGVASPECYKKYISEINAKSSSKISSVRFRDKRIYNGHLFHKFTTISFEDGTEYSVPDNPYTLAYGLGLMHRPCCTECHYATPLRNSDITIGDFWGIEEHFSNMKSEISKGISLLLCHTEKGNKIIQLLEYYMILEKVSSYTLCLNNRQQQLLKPFVENPQRQKFINKTLNDNKSFTFEAKKLAYRYKIEGFIKRVYRRLFNK